MNKEKIIQIVIVLIMIIGFILVWPIGIIRKSAVVWNPESVARSVGPLGEETRISQEFIPAENYIKSISIDLDRKGGSAVNGILNFSIHDGNGKEILIKTVPVAEVADSSFYKFSVEKWVKKGQCYTWNIWVSGINDSEIAPALWCSEVGVITLEENSVLYYAESEDGGNAIVSYEYGVMQGTLAIVTYDAFIVMLGMFAFRRRRKGE